MMHNLIVPMRRQQLSDIKQSDHAGLLLDRGYNTWAEKADTQRRIEQHNTEAHNLHKQAANIPVSKVYEKAFNEWLHIQENSNNSQSWIGKLEGRMYLGMGEASPLEAGITLHQTYGVPFIPGSAIKGVIHHYADDINLSPEIQAVLFGEEADSKDKQNSGAAGYIIFNNAWWIPKDKALTPEVITVHANEYYTKKGKTDLHPDFESPNPNPQIAIQGSFLFSVEGEEKWAKYAIQLLAKALEEKGIGGKTSSGYGFMRHDSKTEATLQDEAKNQAEAKALASMSEEQRIIFELGKLLEADKQNNLKQAGGTTSGKLGEFIQEASTWSLADRIQAAELIEEIYNWHGWGPKKKRPKKQEMLEGLRKDS